MIVKTFEIKSVLIKIEQQNLSLFYGENIGLMDDFKKEIILKNKNSQIIKIDQEHLLKNKETIYSEMLNMSLFEEEKIYFISQSDDKILEFLNNLEKNLNQIKIYLFSGMLNKSSKLRSYFEKSKKYSALPCYQDDEVAVRKIILTKLNGYQGVTGEVINTIIASCNKDRMKLNNEIDKIKSCYVDKAIDMKSLANLLNASVNEDLNELTNAALEGNKLKTNRLLSETIIQDEKSIFFLQLLNYRLRRLIDLISLAFETNIDEALVAIKPPIFWKDKKNFKEQTKKLNKNKINKIFKKTYNLEVRIKSNSNLNYQILTKKLLVDICEVANS